MCVEVVDRDPNCEGMEHRVSWNSQCDMRTSSIGPCEIYGDVKPYNSVLLSVIFYQENQDLNFLSPFFLTIELLKKE